MADAREKLVNSCNSRAAMEDGFRIRRYRRLERDKVFDLLRASLPSAIADRMIKQWDWKYDANPFNAEAGKTRIANRPRLASFVRIAVSPEDLEGFDLPESENAIDREKHPTVYC